MKKLLFRVKTVIYYFDDDGKKIFGIPSGIRGDISCISGSVSDIRGDVSGISGNVSGIRGDVSDIRGNIDECDIKDIEREGIIDIENLVMEVK